MMRTEQDFKAPQTEAVTHAGSFSWSAPSNIALVKYWGKKDHQIPANPSISFTLRDCRTITSMAYSASDSLAFDLLFEGQSKESFRPKVAKFLERILPYCPYLNGFRLEIDTRNTFPHSSGIASSASGMAALAMNVMSLERVLFPEMRDDYFYGKASFLARLGSGSACRSIRGGIVVWGEHADIAGSSDLFGVAFGESAHPIFDDYQDTILLVDKGQKKVSSTLGHELMHGHPYAQERFAQAHRNLADMRKILMAGDLEKFVALTESEALTLHAMMMTSMPYFILMRPNTLEIINRIWDFRSTSNIPVCFTLDAGANVHVLYPKRYAEKVLEFIQAELVGFCENDHYICDSVGSGSKPESL